MLWKVLILLLIFHHFGAEGYFSFRELVPNIKIALSEVEDSGAISAIYDVSPTNGTFPFNLQELVRISFFTSFKFDKARNQNYINSIGFGIR